MSSRPQDLQFKVAVRGAIVVALIVALIITIGAGVFVWFFRYDEGRNYQYSKLVNDGKPVALAFLDEDGYISNIEGNPIATSDGKPGSRYATFTYREGYSNLTVASTPFVDGDVSVLWNVSLDSQIGYGEAATLYNELLELGLVEPLEPGSRHTSLQDYVMYAASEAIRDLIASGEVPEPEVAPTGNGLIRYGEDEMLENYRAGVSATDYVLSQDEPRANGFVRAEYVYECRTAEIGISNEDEFRSAIELALPGVNDAYLVLTTVEEAPFRTPEPCDVVSYVEAGPGGGVMPDKYIAPAPPLPTADPAP